MDGPLLRYSQRHVRHRPQSRLATYSRLDELKRDDSFSLWRDKAPQWRAATTTNGGLTRGRVPNRLRFFINVPTHVPDLQISPKELYNRSLMDHSSLELRRARGRGGAGFVWHNLVLSGQHRRKSLMSIRPCLIYLLVYIIGGQDRDILHPFYRHSTWFWSVNQY